MCLRSADNDKIFKSLFTLSKNQEKLNMDATNALENLRDVLKIFSEIPGRR